MLFVEKWQPIKQNVKKDLPANVSDQLEAVPGALDQMKKKIHVEIHPNRGIKWQKKKR